MLVKVVGGKLGGWDGGDHKLFLSPIRVGGGGKRGWKNIW